MRSAAAVLSLAAALSLACAHELTPEERLERDTQNTAPKEKISPAQLNASRCTDVQAGLAAAHADSLTETERLQQYNQLYDSLKKRAALYDEALKRNPDLAYNSGYGDLSAVHDQCIAATGDVRVEFERFTRDLVSNPTTEEVRAGQSNIVPRVDFDALKRAIASLSPDDRDQLVERVNTAQAKYGSVAAARSKRH